jgi:hypothetical protein
MVKDREHYDYKDVFDQSRITRIMVLRDIVQRILVEKYIKLHDVTSQTTITSIFTAARTSRVTEAYSNATR